MTGKVNQMDLPITIELLEEYLTSLEPIQHVFPGLTAEQREFLLTGYTPEDWKTMMQDPEEGEADE